MHSCHCKRSTRVASCTHAPHCFGLSVLIHPFFVLFLLSSIFIVALLVFLFHFVSTSLFALPHTETCLLSCPPFLFPCPFFLFPYPPLILTYPTAYSSTFPLTYYPPAYSPTHLPFTYPPAYSPTFPLTYPTAYSLTHLPACLCNYIAIILSIHLFLYLCNSSIFLFSSLSLFISSSFPYSPFI